MLLENVRFHAEEEANDPDFARELGDLADIYVSDAFGTAHRAHASVVGVPAFLPAVAGLLMEREVDYLSRVTDDPERPFGLILGGAKVTEKLAILEFLCDRADVICVGGGIANTFLMAQGIDVGASLVEPDRIEDTFNVMREGGDKARPEAGPTSRRRDQRRVRRDGDGGLREPDPTGPSGSWTSVPTRSRTSRRRWRRCGRSRGTDRWGCSSTSLSTRARSRSPTCWPTCPMPPRWLAGAETAAAIARAGVTDRISHCSTGGGASLQLLEGRSLPGLEALLDAE